jgi:hypothetical protein
VTEIDARSQRDDLIHASDWTQAPDAPLTGNEVVRWRAYRQTLRDVPLQPGFPDVIAWPDVPERDPVVAPGEMAPGMSIAAFEE